VKIRTQGKLVKSFLVLFFKKEHAFFLAVLLIYSTVNAQPAPKWVTSWAASDQISYPGGIPRVVPEDAFPGQIARDQSFRLIIKPDLWGYTARLRFSNALGTLPLSLDGVYVGLQQSGAVLVAHSNRPVSFRGQRSVTIPAGETVWSDPVALNFVGYTLSPLIQGRNLAVSFHVAGSSGAMTWHAEAWRHSFVGRAGGGAVGQAEDDAGFSLAIGSDFFLDALDVRAAADAFAVVALGDSITDGVGSTPDAADRWPDVLSRRLHAVLGERVSVVDAGISGNRVLTNDPAWGGPAVGARLARDVTGLSGVGAVIWLEGINDLSSGATPEALAEAVKPVVDRLRAAVAGVRVIGATLTPLRGGPAVADRQRRALNQFLRLTDLFDGLVDFDAALADPQTGALRPAFDSGDGLHPGRAGYAAMGQAVELKLLTR
jgi:lysophospholipase L1-like esterase